MVTQAVILQPMKDHAEADIQAAAHGDSMMQHVDALKEATAGGQPTLEQAPSRSCSLWKGAHAGAGFLAGSVAHMGPMLEKTIPEGPYPIERTHAGAGLKELQPMARTDVGEVHEELYPLGGTPQ